MQDQIKQKLKAIVAQHGVKIVSTPKRVNGLLRDYFPQNMREVRLLSMALDEGMVQTIVQDHTSQSQLMLTARLSQCLHDNFAIDPEMAKWTINTWYEVITTDEKELSGINEVNRLQELAEQGNALAQVKLGLHYITGKGVTKDAQQAFIWFKKSAEQGNEHGQFFLGVMYNGGEGIEANHEQAVAWLKKSAEQGNKDAQELLRATEACHLSDEEINRLQSINQQDDEDIDIIWSLRSFAKQGDLDSQYRLMQVGLSW